MNPNDFKNVPLPGGSYIPYFYQSGLHLSYGTPSSHKPKPFSSQFQTSYDFSPDSSLTSRLEQVQTVEDVIARGYFSTPPGDSTTALLSDKQHTSRLGLGDVVNQIRGRYEIYAQNMEGLDQSICEANNSVFRQEAAQGSPATQMQQYSVQKLTQDVYEQKRAELVNLWRDVSRLRTSLAEVAQQYLSAYRKISILEDHQGDPL